MTWWDSVRKWFDGKKKSKFPTPGPKTPDKKTEYNGAADWIAKRSNLTTAMGSREIAETWTAKARAQSFFSARVSEDHILKELRKVSDAFSRGEIGQAEARTNLKRFLIAEGKDDGTNGLRNLASTARLNLVLTQNARMAAAVGQYQAGMDPDIKKRFPCWRYVRSTAADPRDSHAQYAGKVYSKDDPIWRKIFPPSDFNCKCSVEECDDEPDTAPQNIETADSGFEFDPAHAFEQFDTDQIEDPELRQKAREELAAMLKQIEEAKRKAEEEARRKAEEEARRKAEEEARRKAEAIKAAVEDTQAKQTALENLIEQQGIDSKETREAEKLLKSAMQEEAKLKGEIIPDFKSKNKKQILAELEASAQKALELYQTTNSPEDKKKFSELSKTVREVKKMSSAEVRKKFDKSLADQAVEKIEQKKKNAVDQAKTDAAFLKLTLSESDKESFPDIWKDPVNVSDYPDKKGSIESKKSYFESMIKTKPQEKEKFETLLKSLKKFEKKGKLYEAELEKVDEAVKQAQKELADFRLKNHLRTDLFSQERKNAAHWFKKSADADKVLREKCGEVWQNASEEEKNAVYEYTHGSGKFNRPLSGFTGGSWSQSGYKGPGNVDLNAEGAGDMIHKATDVISRSSYDFDIWLQRGCGIKGISNPFQCGDLSTMSETELQKLVGRSSVIPGFFSTTPVKGQGFSDSVIVNLYAPRGTQMMYCEPFSHYGNGAKKNWDGKSSQKTYGGEFEMLVQRGATYEITKIERKNGRIYIDLDIHSEAGYSMLQQEGKKKK